MPTVWFGSDPPSTLSADEKTKFGGSDDVSRAADRESLSMSVALMPETGKFRSFSAARSCDTVSEL